MHIMLIASETLKTTFENFMANISAVEEDKFRIHYTSITLIYQLQQ